ncbi:stalk domain-containing protein [Cohnella panacarvi]|uniref:stalk domain-containing protein n=1 Tax=Cohnella panacarvi TaxID=400776 RepID=UPI00047A1970|nr:stalk domain-containing protein [Cohnella panacarvi]
MYKFRLKKSFVAGLGLTLVLAVPSIASAASADYGWSTSPKLYEVRTIAGKSELGHANGANKDATFFQPYSAVALPDGRLLVSDYENHLIRVVTAARTDTYAGLDLGQDEANNPIGGFNDDVLLKSAFEHPAGLAIDSKGSIYVADSENNAIRVITKDGKVSTLAGSGKLGSDDGIGAAASFDHPSDVAVAKDGTVYVADTLNHAIRKVASDGKVTTLTADSNRPFEYFPGAVEYSGSFKDGPIASAQFNEPTGLALDSKGNLYVSDRGNQRIRYIDFAAGTVSTVAGGGDLDKQLQYVEGDYIDGEALKARFNAPEGLTIAPDGTLIIADKLNHAIRTLKNGQVGTLAGIATEVGTSDGVSANAQFDNPTDVTILTDGRLVVIDQNSNKIRVLQKYAAPASLPTDKSIKVLLNGELLTTDVPAIMSPGAVLLPIRSVGTALGYAVDYDDKAQTGTLTKGNTVYTIKKNMKTVTKTVDGVATQVTLNSATVQTNDRLFIPVRFFAEESGYDIQWDDKLQIVVIRDKQFN